jgi:histidinol-phosphate aminotransferase
MTGSTLHRPRPDPSGQRCRFVGPETQERARGAAFAARLGANESVFGPSPGAVAAIAAAAAQDTWMYGDPEGVRSAPCTCRRTTAATMENIVIGEGIDGLLGYLVRLLIAPGDAVVTSDGAYPTFNYHVAGYRRRAPQGALSRRSREDPARADRKAPVKPMPSSIYIANPDNPMGSWHDAATMQADDRRSARGLRAGAG